MKKKWEYEEFYKIGRRFRNRIRKGILEWWKLEAIW
jgi:hypothetical protein